jgi:dienelactone hydrolase
MRWNVWFALAGICCLAAACTSESSWLPEYEPPGRGPYAVGSTNLRVAPEFAANGDEAMHGYLLGLPQDDGEPRYVTDVLEHRDAAWIVDVPVPDDPDVYGPASGSTLPVAAFVTWPALPDETDASYAFPYHNAQYGEFENMLAPGETPVFADGDTRYPLIVLSHGSSAHGIYDVGHAHRLSSHGYIVVVPTYGDDRTMESWSSNDHVGFLRPLITRAVVDSLIASETFGPHIDADRIGMSGHSFGGFTSLAAAGGLIYGNPASATDPRVTAAVLAAPWVGQRRLFKRVYAFGPDNESLSKVNVPVLTAFGTDDEVTTARSILPAMKKLGGPTYVVELVDQPHVFEGGSWQDRDGWELLFFNAYLKGDADALEALRTSASMKGGNEDRQLFDYQRLD